MMEIRKMVMAVASIAQFRMVGHVRVVHQLSRVYALRIFRLELLLRLKVLSIWWGRLFKEFVSPTYLNASLITTVLIVSKS